MVPNSTRMRSQRSSKLKRARRSLRRGRQLGVESLEDRRLLAGLPLSGGAQPTDFDQYLLELINRGRANPAAEASRYGMSLNDGLPAGTISTTPKQPLAFSPTLIAAAQGHSQWMIQTDTFSHTGQGGSSPGERMADAGYSFEGSSSWAENIAFQGTTGTFSTIDYVDQIHANLYGSPNHRVNQMNDNLREFGTGVVSGTFLHDGTNYHALLVTEKFAYSGNSVFLTGVVFDDGLVSANEFYTPGEGLEGVTVTATRLSDGQSFSAQTWGSGGYTLPVPGGTYTVTAAGGALNVTLVKDNVSVADRNVKVDFTLADNAAPVISSLAATPSNVTRPDTLTLTAHGVSDPNGHVSRVEFYLDTNGNGVWDPSDQVLGTIESASDGWTWSGSTAGWEVGQHRLFARVQSDDGAWSESATTTVIVQNANPFVESLSASPSVVLEGQPIELTAAGVNDAEATVVRVDFYRNGILLGSDTDGSQGWTWTGNTAGWTAGAQEFSARAWDNDEASSELVTTTAVLVAQLPPLDFGVVPVFARAQRELVICNDGPEPLIVPGLQQELPFAMHPPEGSGEADDWIIAPGASVSFVVSYLPTEEGADHAVVPLIGDPTGRHVEHLGLAVAGWQNTVNPFDVNGSGAATPSDVLLLINEINYRGVHKLPQRTAEQPGPPWFLDPNGDGRLTPADALAVINHINVTSASVPEGEADRAFCDWDEGFASLISIPTIEARVDGTSPGTSDRRDRHEQPPLPIPTAPDTGLDEMRRVQDAARRESLAGFDYFPQRKVDVAIHPFDLEALLSDLLDS